ncbi:MAG: amidohydrolase family protein [Clostridia bacterium]|nr:amidohydrolase family protein [Clostridia bacterium]MCI2000719.1 amidohydrolase family protein [Clostridia bacterium]MCI2015208.1 amidohydrolase family protein [Clostridia bacterium]
MKKLDAHIHLGWDYVFDEGQTEEQILTVDKEFGITGGIVQPYLPRMYMEDTRQIHNRVKKFCDDNPTYYGMVSINPHFSPEDYITEATRCVKELGFVGLKITTLGHACHPGSKDAYTVYKTALKLGVPVMVHTGAGAPFADPIQLEKPLMDFPDLKIVIAHCGKDEMSTQAISLARRFENCYLEPSWCSVVSLKKMKETVGPEKIMFSADVLHNIATETTIYDCIFKDEKEREQVFYKTCESVFNLK